MSFTLRIAARTDRNARTHGVPEFVSAPTPSVATIVAGGRMHEADAARLAEAWQEVFRDGADTVVVELHESTFADAASRARFVRAVLDERRATHHLYVRALEPASHAALAAEEDAAAWLMASQALESGSPRRAIIAHSPATAPAATPPEPPAS